MVGIRPSGFDQPQSGMSRISIGVEPPAFDLF
jgi:hypothetical protein